jgi:hypothetical protein
MTGRWSNVHMARSTGKPASTDMSIPQQAASREFRVSVIIATKNRPDALALAVRTLLAQTVPPVALVVVDQSAGEESRRRETRR